MVLAFQGLRIFTFYFLTYKKALSGGRAVPALRRREYSDVGVSLNHWTGRRFRSVSWICLAGLVLTGIFNLSYRGIGWTELTSRELWQSPFGQILGVKLTFLVAILLLSIFHDFVIGPRAANVLQANPSRTKLGRYGVRRAGSNGSIFF